MAPWYEIPRTGGVPMYFDRERPDLEPAEAPAAAAGEKPARKQKAAEKPAESEAKAG
jgi:hypothetical protein